MASISNKKINEGNATSDEVREGNASINYSEEELLRDDNEECIPFTSSEDLRQIVDNDSTVAVVGYVESIESTKIVGQKNLRLFKFMISNGDGERLQVAVWNDEIDNVEHLVKPNAIIHLDCARSKAILNPNFNKGTIPYELSIQSYTSVNILGKHNLTQHGAQFTPELIQMSDIGEKAQYIRVHAYIKSVPRAMTKQGSQINEICAGSITDGVYKTEFRMPNTDAIFDFEDGDHVEIIGFAQTNANPIHIFVKSETDIKKLDGTKMKLKDLLRGVKIPKSSNNQDSATKRARLQ